jgi:GT2 family glycosyltransferase
MTWINPILETAWLISDAALDHYPVPLAPGGCQAFRRDTFHSLGGYDEGLVRWGFEDIELSVRVWLLGLTVTACPSVAVAHWFRDAREFEVTDETVLLNFLRFIHLHFSAPRIRRILRAASQVYALGKALDLVYASDVFVQRSYWAQRRVYTDDWFVSTFGLPV